MWLAILLHGNEVTNDHPFHYPIHQKFPQQLIPSPCWGFQDPRLSSMELSPVVLIRMCFYCVSSVAEHIMNTKLNKIYNYMCILCGKN